MLPYVLHFESSFIIKYCKRQRIKSSFFPMLSTRKGPHIQKQPKCSADEVMLLLLKYLSVRFCKADLLSSGQSSLKIIGFGIRKQLFFCLILIIGYFRFV